MSTLSVSSYAVHGPDVPLDGVLENLADISRGIEPRLDERADAGPPTRGTLQVLLATREFWPNGKHVLSMHAMDYVIAVDGLFSFELTQSRPSIADGVDLAKVGPGQGDGMVACKDLGDELQGGLESLPYFVVMLSTRVALMSVTFAKSSQFRPPPPPFQRLPWGIRETGNAKNSLLSPRHSCWRCCTLF